MKKIISSSIIVSSLLMSGAYAEAEAPLASTPESSIGNFGITGKSGTLGAGVDVTYGINDKLNARLNINGGKFSYNEKSDDVNYKGDLDAFSAGGLLDFHPTGGGFRITGGIYKNGNELNLKATGDNNASVQIGDNSYDISNASLDTNVSAKGVSPYLGIGWGNAVNKEKKWNFSLDAGVLFQASPEVTIKGEGTATELSTGQSIDLATDALFQSDLQKEEENVNNDIKDFKVYPVVSLGMSYRFY